MVSLEDRLSNGKTETAFYRQNGHRIQLTFPRGEAPQYYILVEHHSMGYHAHVLKLVKGEYVRTNQMITRVGEEYFIETHSKKRAQVHLHLRNNLDDILQDVIAPTLEALSQYPDEHMRKPNSYAQKIYP